MMIEGKSVFRSMSRRLAIFQGILPIDRSQFLKNLGAGFSLAAMNIPQAMGYARIAAMPVITGLYTLVFPVMAFALLGSSRYLVVASDSATAAILAGGLMGMAPAGTRNYVALAGFVALLTAALLLLARILKLGFLADFLSHTVLIGFLTGVGFQVGIAVLSEMLRVEVRGRNSAMQLAQVVRLLPRAHLPTVVISITVVAVLLFLRRVAPRWPGALMAVIAAITCSAKWDFSGRGIEVIGPIEGGLPHLSIPVWDGGIVLQLLPIAGSCFVMIVAQSSVTARAYAARHHQALDENRDLLGLSAANVAATLSGTFVVNGSPTQTAMMEFSGGNSQLATLSTALLVIMVLLYLTGPLQYLPVCVLGAIVFTIAIRLVDLRGLHDLSRKSPHEWRLALVTTASVVFLGVKEGILLAVVVSLLQHVRHGYRPHTAVILHDVAEHWRMESVAPGKMMEPGLVMYWFGSDLFYANAGHFAEQLRKMVTESPSPLRWLVVDASAITDLDYSAGRTLKELQQDLKKKGVVLALTRVGTSLKQELQQQELVEVIGANRIFTSRTECLEAFRLESGKGDMH